MIALAITAATLVLVIALVIALERRRRLTPVTATITGLGTLTVVFAAVTATIITSLPASANGVPRGHVDQPLVERVVDVELPTL